ncbi:MAG: hypothetical protein ACRER3_06265, partial [Pseudomonas fluorescens]
AHPLKALSDLLPISLAQRQKPGRNEIAADESCDFLTFKSKIKRSQPSAAPTLDWVHPSGATVRPPSRASLNASQLSDEGQL